MVTRYIDQSSENYEKNIMEAWNKFIRGESLDGYDIPKYVLEGWSLSKKNNIDPILMQTPNILNKKDMSALLFKHKVLLEAAEPMLKMLAASIEDSGCIATLMESSGFVLDVVGDSKAMQEGYKSYNVKGADRSIKSIGSSALTLSIIARKAISLKGAEHYNKFWHNWKCVSAPIYNYDKTIIAAISISNKSSSTTSHTLALAQSCADGISLRLREGNLLENEKRYNAMFESFQNALPKYMVTLDETGQISYANKKALQFLNLKLDFEKNTLYDIFPQSELKKVEHIVNTSRNGSYTLNVITHRGVQKLDCQFISLQTKDFTPCGTMISMNKVKDFFDITGNRAEYYFDDIIGNDANLKEQIKLANRASSSSFKILLSGENGTGKELFAQSIHNASPFATGPFVAISCAAIPRDLLESELFGYVEGAFTGAKKEGMVGKMELANNGTLFLDEVNSLPLEMQAKLLRALQQMSIVPIGGRKSISINTRVIAATNKDLKKAVENGEFREDLYYRLNVIEILIPPLRARKNDIPILANLFLNKLLITRKITKKIFEESALTALQNYSWPGNIRELENICERAFLLSENDNINLSHLPEHIARLGDSTTEITLSKNSSIEDNLKKIIHDALISQNGNISNTAKQLGIARCTLYRKIKQLNIEYNL